MKALLLAGLLVVSLKGAAQTLPPSKANVVIIQTPDSAVTALSKLATVFVNQGYTVEKLDKQFLTLALAPKTIANKYNPILTVHSSATPSASSSLRIIGEYKGFTGDVPLAGFAQFYGSEGACNKTCFRQIEKAGMAYPGGKISYAKQ